MRRHESAGQIPVWSVGEAIELQVHESKVNNTIIGMLNHSQLSFLLSLIWAPLNI